MLTFSNPNAFGEEGVDHLNISNQSKTQLGLLLDPSYFKVVDYPHIGKFGSVMNLWYWLKASPLDDSLRRVTGFRLKDKVSSGNTQNRVPNFRAIIATATYLKLKQYPHCLKQLRELPEGRQILSYYVPKGTGLRMCSNYAELVCSLVSVIRLALREGAEPDFTKLATYPSDARYFFLEPFLLENFGADRLAEFTTAAA